MDGVDPDAAGGGKRRVGRPSLLESGGASLAMVLGLIRSGEATTRLDIERASDLGRAVVADRLTALEALGLIADGELGPAIGGRAGLSLSDATGDVLAIIATVALGIFSLM